MHEIGFGRFESLRIERDELVLEPWPTAIRTLKFGMEEAAKQTALLDEFGVQAPSHRFLQASTLYGHWFNSLPRIAPRAAISMEITHGPASRNS